MLIIRPYPSTHCFASRYTNEHCCLIGPRLAQHGASPVPCQAVSRSLSHTGSVHQLRQEAGESTALIGRQTELARPGGTAGGSAAHRRRRATPPHGVPLSTIHRLQQHVTAQRAARFRRSQQMGGRTGDAAL